MYDTDDTTAHEPTEKRSLRFATDLEADVLALQTGPPFGFIE